jgi:signal transduction histidine kinase
VNAIKFSSNEGVITIITKYYANDQMLTISVKDNGIGISA